MSEVNSMGDRTSWAEDYHATLAEKAAEEARRQRDKAAEEVALALQDELVEKGIVQLGLE